MLFFGAPPTFNQSTSTYVHLRHKFHRPSGSVYKICDGRGAIGGKLRIPNEISASTLMRVSEVNTGLGGNFVWYWPSCTTPCNGTGEYNDQDPISVITACKICRLGTVPATNNLGFGRGATACVNNTGCPVGEYSGVGKCEYCEVGRYQPVPNATVNSCIDCIAGRYNNKTGQYLKESCKKCAPGQMSVAHSANCTNCLAGEYSSVDATDCKVTTLPQTLTLHGVSTTL